MKKKTIQIIINIMLGILFLFQGIHYISYEGKISFWPCGSDFGFSNL